MNTPQNTRTESRPDRRLILACGMILLACLGTVYAWSFFTRPLADTYGWSKLQIGGVFSLAVAGLGLSAAYTGPLVSKLGSRKLMYRSAVFFVAGYLVTALGLYLAQSGVFGDVKTNAVASWTTLGIVALGYGVIGGIGLGTGYVTGVTTVAGWFTDKKGFATGMVVMGFGMGGFVMSKVFAPLAMSAASDSIPLAFLLMAVAYAVIMPLACRGIHSPDTQTSTGRAATVADSITHGDGVAYRLVGVCFLYSLAGLGIISLLSPLMQKMALHDDPGLDAVTLAGIGASLVAAASLGNSLGRLFWAWFSDKIGRVNAFVLMLASAACVFLALPYVTSPLLYAACLTFTIASYGGGFGTIPSLISDLYGTKRMSAVHGKALVGWAAAGLISPPIFGYLSDRFPEDAAQYAFYTCAGSLFLASALVATFKSLHVTTTAQVSHDKSEVVKN